MKGLVTLRHRRRLLLVELLKRGLFSYNKKIMKVSELKEIIDEVFDSRISKMVSREDEDLNILQLLLFKNNPVNKQNKIDLIFKIKDTTGIVKGLMQDMNIKGNHLSRLIENIYVEIQSVEVSDGETIKTVELNCEISDNALLKYAKSNHFTKLIKAIRFDSQLSNLELFYNSIPKIVLKKGNCEISNVSLICNLDEIQKKYLYPFYCNSKRQEYYNPCVDVSDLEFLEAFVEFDNGLGKFFIIEFNRDYYINRNDFRLVIDSIESPLMKIALDNI